MSQYLTVCSHFFSRIQDHKRFILLIAFFLLLSAVFCSVFKSQKLWGDEETYLVESHTQPLSNGYFAPLVPGAMQYRWWPPFAFSFYALFSTDSLGNHYAGAASLPVKELERIRRGSGTDKPPDSIF
jgi:hypothetical protein